MKKTILACLITSATVFIGLTSSANANTCPNELQQNAHGFWYSNEPPKWTSHKATPHDIKLNPRNFGGVVFSPAKKRIACVYKASNGKWVALVSRQNKGFSIVKDAKDDSGKRPAWRWSKKHKDYACGNPTVKNIVGCQFNIAN